MAIGPMTIRLASSPAGTATARERQVPVPRLRNGIATARPISTRPAANAAHAGDVATGQAVGVDVADVHGAVDDGEDAEREREAGLQARPQPREGDDRADPGSQRDQAGERVLAEAEPRPRGA